MRKMLPLWTLVLLIIAYLVYQHFFERNKTGYVLIQDVYSQFNLKKDMQKNFEKSHNTRKKILDSLVSDIGVIGRRIDADKGKDTAAKHLYLEKRFEYFETKRRLEQDDSSQMKQYDEEILGQLNQYIKDYAKEHHYQYIFGNGAGGSLVAADEGLNITAPITQYVNQRYEGKK